MRSKVLNGFSLLELSAVLVMATTLTAVLSPAMRHMRSQMQGVTSEGNLHTIGQAGAMYGLDFDDRVFTYSWQAGEEYINLANGNSFIPGSDRDAGSRQMQNILQRATGRLMGNGKILNMAARIPHRRYSHLVLADYLGGNVSDPLWVDPADANLLHWQLNPLEYLQDNNSFPYGNGLPNDKDGYDNDASWANNAVLQKWAFASSYQTVPHAWQNDFGPQYVPNFDTPHLFTATAGQIPLGGRHFNEVRFPSAKVHMFEEFDREQEGSPYFGYDHAQPAKLMFDGSINTAMSGLANSSVSPQDYLSGRKTMWAQDYLPLDTFPIPLEGLGPQEFPINMRYRWTLGGLQGIDYPQTLMPAR